jgi:hypothetical protein
MGTQVMKLNTSQVAINMSLLIGGRSYETVTSNTEFESDFRSYAQMPHEWPFSSEVELGARIIWEEVSCN